MALKLYVKSLVALLKDLGMDQKAIARQLHASESVVSYWSTGTRPLPKRHKAAFYTLVLEAIRADRARPHDFSVNSAEHERTIGPHLAAWIAEMYVTTSTYRREVREDLTTLRSPYAGKDPLDIPRDERQALGQAALRLGHRLHLLDVAGVPQHYVPARPDAEFERLWQLYEGDDDEGQN